MQDRLYPEVPDDFGNWLAGFVDGEGHFAIIRKTTRTTMISWSIELHVTLRRDDAAILVEIFQRTGCGVVRNRDRTQKKMGNRSPSTEWVVSSKPNIARMVELFDRFPLRAKKRRDYEIWREAALYWTSLRPVRATRGGQSGMRGHVPYDWSPVERLAAEMKVVRQYREIPLDPVIPVTRLPADSPRLFD